MARKFKLDASQIEPLVPHTGGCLATDRITVDGERIGYMYREQPARESDSGWRFFAGDESDEYVNNPDNISVYSVNTICNYDPDIVPLLNAPYSSAFVREPESGKFVREEFKPPE